MKRNALPAAAPAAADSSLACLQPLETFQRAHVAVFPSLESARWFVRQHRAALAEAGALAFLNRRLLIHPSRFAEAALRIGTTAARRG